MDIHKCARKKCPNAALGFEEYCPIHSGASGEDRKIETPTLIKTVQHVDDAHDPTIGEKQIHTCIVCGVNKVPSDDPSTACKLCTISNFPRSDEARVIKSIPTPELWPYIIMEMENQNFIKNCEEFLERIITETGNLLSLMRIKLSLITEKYTLEGNGPPLELYPNFRRSSIDVETFFMDENILDENQIIHVDRPEFEVSLDHDEEGYKRVLNKYETIINLQLKNPFVNFYPVPEVERIIRASFNPDANKIFNFNELHEVWRKKEWFWYREINVINLLNM